MGGGGGGVGGGVECVIKDVSHHQESAGGQEKG